MTPFGYTVLGFGSGGVRYSESIPAGAPATADATAIHYITTYFDPHNANKFLIQYRDADNSYYGTMIVGTVSGTSLSFGTPVVFNSGSNSNHLDFAMDPNTENSLVIVYRDNGNSEYGTSIVGTIDGTSISFGAEVVFESTAGVKWNRVSFDPHNANKFVVMTANSPDTEGSCVVGTVDGTSHSYGTPTNFSDEPPYNQEIAFDPNTANKFVVSWSGNSTPTNRYGTSAVGTLSGDSISFGTEVVWKSDAVNSINMVADPNTANNYIIVYEDRAGTNLGAAIAGTVSGTTMSFGSAVTFDAAGITDDSNSPLGLGADPNNAGKFVISYTAIGNNDYGTAIVGTVDGTSLSFGDKSVFHSDQTSFTSLDFDSNGNGKFVIAYKKGMGDPMNDNDDYVMAVVGQIAT